MTSPTVLLLPNYSSLSHFYPSFLLQGQQPSSVPPAPSISTAFLSTLSIPFLSVPFLYVPFISALFLSALFLSALRPLSFFFVYFFARLL